MGIYEKWATQFDQIFSQEVFAKFNQIVLSVDQQIVVHVGAYNIP